MWKQLIYGRSLAEQIDKIVLYGMNRQVPVSLETSYQSAPLLETVLAETQVDLAKTAVYNLSARVNIPSGSIRRWGRCAAAFAYVWRLIQKLLCSFIILDLTNCLIRVRGAEFLPATLCFRSTPFVFRRRTTINGVTRSQKASRRLRVFSRFLLARCG